MRFGLESGHTIKISAIAHREIVPSDSWSLVRKLVSEGHPAKQLGALCLFSSMRKSDDLRDLKQFHEVSAFADRGLAKQVGYCNS